MQNKIIANFGAHRLGLIASELHSTIDFEIVEFSIFVRDRAWALAGATGYKVPLGKSEEILTAIRRSGDGFTEAVDFLGQWFPKEERAAKSIEKERIWQKLLLDESIANDQAALDYMEHIRPSIEALANQWDLSRLRSTEDRLKQQHETRARMGYRETKIRPWERRSKQTEEF